MYSPWIRGGYRISLHIVLCICSNLVNETYLTFSAKGCTCIGSPWLIC